MKNKKAIVVCTVACFLDFELNDIKILESLGYTVYVATNFNTYEDMHDMLTDMGVRENHQLQVNFTRSPFTAEIPKAYFELEKILEKGQFNLMHCHTPVGGVLGRLAAKHYNDRHPDKRMTVIYTAHGFHFYNGAPKKNWMLYYPIEKQLSKYTDVLITINHENYHRASEKFFAKKTVYIPGVGVDTRRFSETKVDKHAKCQKLGIPEHSFLLLSVGELNENKNHKVVLEVLRLLRDNDIYYIIAGQGPCKDEYNEYILRYGLSDNVKLLGHRDDVDKLYKISDCLIHPSIREGLGIAPIEAMAAGLPLITSHENGMKDYVENGRTGICIEDPHDVRGFAKAIAYMKSHPEFREKCSRYNTNKAKEFDISNTAKIMTEVYKEAGDQ